MMHMMTSDNVDNVATLMLNLEPEPDCDTLSDIVSVFPVQFSTAASTCLGLDTCTVTQLSRVSREQVCCLAHTGLVTTYDVSSTALTRVWSVPCDPEARVTGISTCQESDSRTLVTSSSDGCVRVWDMREEGSKPALVLRDTSEHRGPPVTSVKPLSCVAARSGASLLVAGTEQVGQDAWLLFWDTRAGGKLLGGYWSVHSDDVTSLQFSPDNCDLLASGGTDGHINVLDITKSEEEEALTSCHNTNDSVAGIQWVGDKRILVSTHTEGLQDWAVDTGNYSSVTR